MIILGTNSIKDTGYDVANSCRFNAGSSDSLTRTLGTPTNNKKWTYSFWIKHCDNVGNLLNTGSDTAYIYFRPNNANPAPYGFSIEQYVGGFQYRIIPNMVFRDHSAWRHIVIAFDTTQGTDTNRVKVYNNGTQITSFNTATYPSQNLDTQVNSAVSHKIGGFASGADFDGYMSEVCFIDGQQLAADQFGEFDEDSNIWKPIDVSGLTFGNNGFYLDFENSGALGADVSGNSNNFTVNNLTAIDQSTDTCTNNGTTFQPLDLQASTQTFAEGNLKVTTDSSGWDTIASTIGVTSGKWYFEAKLITLGNYAIIGVIDINDANLNTTSSYYIGASTPDNGYQNNGARPDTGGGFGASYTANDIIGIAIDMDNLKVYFSKNGTFQNSGNPTSGATGTGAQDLTASTTYCFAISGHGSTVWEANFGSPSFAISSGNTDGDGYGNFEYAVPSGYYSLNTKNLSEYG